MARREEPPFTGTTASSVPPSSDSDAAASGRFVCAGAGRAASTVRHQLLAVGKGVLGTGRRQVRNRQRKDEVLIDVHDVALGHTTKMGWNDEDKWIYSDEASTPPIIDDDPFLHPADHR